MIKWSYSKLSTYESCPEKYYRKYELQERPEENQRKYLEGAVLQTLFEEYVNGGHYTTEDKAFLLANLDRHFNHFMTERAGKIHLKKDEDLESIKNKIKKYIDNTYDFFVYKKYGAASVFSEFEFKNLRLNNSLYICGSIDFLIRHVDGSFDILDLKTTANKKFINKDQLLFYVLLMYVSEGAVPKESYFYNAAKNEIINVPVRVEDVQDLVDRLKRYTKEIENTRYRHLVKSECWGCAHKELCLDDNGGDFSNGRGSFTR